MYFKYIRVAVQGAFCALHPNSELKYMIRDFCDNSFSVGKSFAKFIC